MTTVSVFNAAQGQLSQRELSPSEQQRRDDEQQVFSAVQQAEGYKMQRRLAYPPLTELADAMVKISSSDTQLKAEGEAQLADYYDACLTVKQTYPKPQGVA